MIPRITVSYYVTMAIFVVFSLGCLVAFVYFTSAIGQLIPIYFAFVTILLCLSAFIYIFFRVMKIVNIFSKIFSTYLGKKSFSSNKDEVNVLKNISFSEFYGLNKLVRSRVIRLKHGEIFKEFNFINGENMGVIFYDDNNVHSFAKYIIINLQKWIFIPDKPTLPIKRVNQSEVMLQNQRIFLNSTFPKQKNIKKYSNEITNKMRVWLNEKGVEYDFFYV